MQGFGEVGLADVGGAVEVGNRAGHLKDAVLGAGGETEMLHSFGHQGLCGGVQTAVFPNVARLHLRVAEQAVALRRKAPPQPAAPGPPPALKRWRTV